MDERLKDKGRNASYFRFFNEIGIISQLSDAVLAKSLPAGFMPSHFGVLNHLSRNPQGRTPLFLARAFQVPKNTMTHTLSGLLKHELVEQKPHPKDGRSKIILITPSGYQFLNDALRAIQPNFANFDEHFSVESIEALIPALEKIRIFMDEDRNTDDFAD